MHDSRDTRREALHPSDSAEPQISRRQALGKVGKALAWTEVTALSLPLISEVLAGRMAMFSRIREQTATVRCEISDYPRTDSECQIPSGKGSFHNLGVAHSAFQLESWKKIFYDRIENADIILVEHGNISEIKDEAFFGPLVEYARSQGKRVIDIDMQKVSGVVTWPLPPALSTIAAVGLGVRRVNADKREMAQESGEEQKSPVLDKMVKRFPLRVRGWIGFLGTTRSPEVAFDLNDYPRGNFSYWIDGRTIKMLQNIESIVRSNPDKKVLAITGDVHARGFEHYSTRSWQFHVRGSLYDLTWDKAFGRPMKEVR